MAAPPERPGGTSPEKPGGGSPEPERPGGGSPAPGSRAAALDIEDRDPGLARARTELAWIRTAVSFSAVGAGILRWHFALGAVLLLVGLAVWLVGRLSVHGVGPELPHRTRMLAITSATLLVAALALSIALLSPGPPSWLR